MAARKTRMRRAALGTAVLTAMAATPCLAQDQPPPPPLAPRGPKGAEKLIDPTSPDFRGAVLGDLSESRTVNGERVVWAVGGASQPVWIRYGDFEIRCENAVIWGDKERLDATLTRKPGGTDPPDLLGNVYHAIYAEGGVYVRRDKYQFHATRVLLDFQHDRAYLVDVLLQGMQRNGSGQDVPLSVRAAVVRGIGRDRYRAENSVLTSCTYEHPHLAFSTSWVEVDFSKREPQFETGWWPTVRADTPVANDVPLIPIPKLGGSLGTRPIQSIEVGSSGRLGTTLGVGFGGEVARGDGSTWGSWQLSPRYRSRRGPGLGIEMDHTALPDSPGRPQDRLEFKAEYQRDGADNDSYSNQPFDGVPGGSSDSNRGRADLWYRNYLGENGILGSGWRLDLSGAWHSDRGYIPEYHTGDATTGLQQETYAHLRRTWGNQGLSILASYRLNEETNALALDTSTDYANQTQYLPSATWHLVNQPILTSRFAPVNLSVEASVAHVERRYDVFTADAFERTGWESTDLYRGDIETRVTTPFEIGPVQVTPAFGGSLYHVSEANGFANAGTSAADESQGRGAAFYALRAGTEFHRTFDAKSATLDLDGLRHVASLDTQWFNRFRVTDDTPFEFQTNDLHDQLFEQNVLSFGLRNRLQTKRDGDVVDWIDYEARILYYVQATDAFGGTGLGMREEFATPLERIDFPGEEKYLAQRRDGSAVSEHRARVELTRELWLVGEVDYDLTQSFMETSAAGVRWFPEKRFSIYVGRRTIHDDSAIWTVHADYVASDKWAFSAGFQQDTKESRGLRTQVGLYRRSHDFTIAIEFESERLLDETGVSFMIYPHAWMVRKGDPFSQRRRLDFDALRWYR